MFQFLPHTVGRRAMRGQPPCGAVTARVATPRRLKARLFNARLLNARLFNAQAVTPLRATVMAALLLGALVLGTGCAPMEEYSLPSNVLTSGTPGALDAAEVHTTGATGTSYAVVPFGMRYLLYLVAEDPHTISLTLAASDVSWELYDPSFTIRFYRCDAVWAVGDESCTITAADYGYTDPGTGTTVSLGPSQPAGLSITEWDNGVGNVTLTIDP